MKRYLLFLLLTLGQLSCTSTVEKQNNKNMFGLFKKDDPIKNFWRWFSENEKSYRNFQENPNKYLNELLAKAKIIAPRLAIELEPPKGGIINMTISADGDKNLFPTVQQIVDKAPKITGWHFFAFRQRMPIDKVKGMILKDRDNTLDPSKMKFYPIISGDTLDIIVYVDHVTKDNKNQVSYGCLMLLDNLLGEYDCVKKVRSYDFQTLPTETKELAELKPLIEVAKYVDDFYLRKN